MARLYPRRKAVNPIEREPMTSEEHERAKLIKQQAASGMTITGPAAPKNAQQNPGQSVSGGARITGGNAGVPAK